jgi:hypothetical protein
MILCSAVRSACVLGLLATGALRAEDVPTTQLPYTPSLDPAAMDRTADPCQDLYQFPAAAG